MNFGRLLISLFLLLCSEAFAAEYYGIYNLGISDNDYLVDLNDGPNLPLALQLAKASELAYTGQLNASDEEFFADNGFAKNKITFFDFRADLPITAALNTYIDPRVHGVTLTKQITVNGESKKLIIVSFRGTEVSAGADDILADVLAKPESFQANSNIKVHLGFNRYFKAARLNEVNIYTDTSSSALIDNALLSLSADILNPDTVFVITGHSLGGAIAKLYGASLRERGIPPSRVMVYTFGAPPVGFGLFGEEYNSLSGNKPLKIIDSVNELDPVYNIAAIDFPKAPVMWHAGQRFISFDVNGDLKPHTGRCNLTDYLRLADWISPFPIASTIANANRYDNNPMCKPSAHMLGGYIKNLYKNTDLSSIANRLAADGLAGITFDVNELLALGTVVTQTRYQNAISGYSFEASKLSAADLKQLVQEVRALGIPISTNNFGNLGIKLQNSIQEITNSKQAAIEAAKNKIDSAQSLGIDEYKKLAFGSAINVISGVADVVGAGGANLAIKLPKVSITAGKMTNVILRGTSLVAKTTPVVMKNAVILADSKKFKFLIALIQAGFTLDDEMKGIIESDAATAEMVSHIIGLSIDVQGGPLQDAVTRNKGKFASFFLKMLNDIVTPIIQSGTTTLIEDQTAREAVDDFIQAVSETLPIVGPYFAQWNLGQKVSNDIDNKPEVALAWAEFDNLYSHINAQIDAVGEIAFRKRLDVIINSTLTQIKNYHVAIPETPDDSIVKPDVVFVLPQDSSIDYYKISTSEGSQIQVVPSSSANYFLEHIKEGIDNGQPLVLRYTDVLDLTIKTIPITVETNINGAYILAFDAPSTMFIPQEICYNRDGDSSQLQCDVFPTAWGFEESTALVDIVRPDGCPTTATDIACKVGLHTISSLDISQPKGIEVLGDFSFVVDSEGLNIFDISDPFLPKLVSLLRFSGIQDIDISGSYAYITGENKIHVIDISNPLLPAFLSSLDADNAKSIEIYGQYAYVGLVNNGMMIVDISNPTSLISISFFGSDKANEVKVNGYMAYVADGYDGIKVIDVSNPASPFLVGSLDTSNARGIEIFGQVAYVADGGAGIKVVDISNPMAPHIIDAFDTLDAYSLEIDGNFAYVADGAAGIKVFDITNPSSLSIVGFLESSNSYFSTNIKIHNQLAYVVASYYEIKIVDISNPSFNKETEIIDTSYPYHSSQDDIDIEVKGNYIYKANANGGIEIIDKNLSTIITSIDPGNIKRIEVSGNYIFASDYTSVVIIDISTPKSPVITDRINDIGYVREVKIYNGFAFIATSNGLEVVNVESPSLKYSIATHEDSTFPGVFALDVSGNYAYLGTYRDLLVYDISDLSAINQVSNRFYGHTYHDIDVVDNYMYIVSDHGFRIIDISNPTIPLLVFSTGEAWYRQSTGVDIDNGYAFVTSYYGRGVDVFDVSNPVTPVFYGNVEAPSHLITDVEVTASNMYVGSTDGVSIIHDWKKSIERKKFIQEYYYPQPIIHLIGESPLDYSIKTNTFTKTWTFSDDISSFEIEIISNTYGSSIDGNSFTKNGNVLSVNLTPDSTLPTNKLELKFTDNGNPVTVSGSDTFWAISKTNHAPRFADGQSTHLVSLTSEPAYLKINTYDVDVDSVVLSIEDSAGGYVGFDPDDASRLFASFNDGITSHTIKIGLDDGKEKVIKSLVVNQFNSNNIQSYYSDISSTSTDYPFSGIAFGTLKGVLEGQLDPNDPTQRLFKPLDQASLAETLKIIIKSASKAGLIQVNPANEYIQTYPEWAMPYYTYARDRGALDSVNDNIAAVYPTREDVARLLVKLLGLDDKLQEFTNISISFTDDAVFSNEMMKRYAQITQYFGLFMTGDTANPQATINRAELALVIEKIFMMPNAKLINFNPSSIEYGDTFAANLVDVTGEMINANYDLVDTSNNIQHAFLTATTALPEPIDSLSLEPGENTLYAVLENNGVKNIISESIYIDLKDDDSDGVQNRLDVWADDGRYAFDDNQNGIPDILDEHFSLANNQVSDTVVIYGVSIKVSQLIEIGGLYYSLDYDNDEIPDIWELRYGLDPVNASDALLDSDGDNKDNISEYIGGTDPTDATDADKKPIFHVEGQIDLGTYILSPGTSSSGGATIGIVQNAGDAVLRINTVRYVGDSEIGVQNVESCIGEEIDPDAGEWWGSYGCQITFSYSHASLGVFEGNLLFTTNDPVNPEVTVPIQLEITPVPLILDNVDGYQKIWNRPVIDGVASTPFIDYFTYSFVSNGKDRVLHITSYDIDYSDEICIYLNNKNIACLDGSDNQFGSPQEIGLQFPDQVQGLNIIELRQKYAADLWGYKNIGLYDSNVTTIPVSSKVVTRAEISKPVLQAIYGNEYIPPTSTGTVFTDVQLGDFNAAWIEKLAAEGITEGCAVNRYCPDMVVTKEQLAKIFLKAVFGSDYIPTPATGSLFSDVSQSSFAARWIEEFSNQGFATGCDANNFCPNQVITIEGFETMLNKAFP